MQVAVVTFDGINELDGFIASALEECGVTVLDAPFHAEGRIATAGGCLASQYLAAWTIARTLGDDAARTAIEYAAPVGEKAETVERVMAAVRTGAAAPR
ncbi:hypothetical protein OG216_03260 [Streptomycetaceae bacterium NBC_01309]